MTLLKKNPLTFWIVLVIGFTSITAQIILMRELVVIFYGNELSVGIMLGIWLLWTSVGSGVLSHLFKKTHRFDRVVAFFQILLSILLPIMLILVRTSRGILNITLGEMIGFIPMLLITLIALAPFCLLGGLLYTLACRLVHQHTGDASASIGKVYLWEALGAGVGGLVTSLILVRYISPATVFLFLSLLNLISAIALGNFNPFRVRIYRLGWHALVILCCSILFLRLDPLFRIYYDKIPWKGYDLITTRNTIFGNISVTRLGDQFSFFQNGLLVFSTPDKMTAEESVHFTLLEHPEPKNVLLIGGGIGGGIEETLHHPTVEKIEYVELDPEIVRLAEQVLPKEQTWSLGDSQVNLHYMDGRRFIKRTSEMFDVIIINLPNPYTAQLNRFYTLEFFREVKRRLRQDGVFSLQVLSSENAIGPELSDFLSTLSATLKEVFAELVIIPGETNRFIVSDQIGQLTSNPQVLVQRLKERNLPTLYVREYYIPFQMSRERQSYLQSQIHPVSSKHLNRDFKPIGYFYDTILWATYFSAGFKKLFLVFARLKHYHIAVFFVFTALLLILVNRCRRKRHGLFFPGILYSVIGIGFTEISLEVILILGFQILYGFAYQQLAVIVAGYMVGLALGSWSAISKNKSEGRIFPLFRFLQFCMFLYPILIVGILWLSHRNSSYFQYIWMTSWLFPVLTAGAGFIGGYQFPLANRLYIRSGKSVQRVAGLLYGYDLLGSSVGAILTSAFLVPILGIFPTLLLLSFLNICSFIVVSLSKKQEC